MSRQMEVVSRLRNEAVRSLHALCSGFVSGVNAHLTRTKLELAPEELPGEPFHIDRPNLLQIQVRGRLLQIELDTPDELISTENFRIPYVLEGAVRAFNQDLLDRNAIEEQYLFACIDKDQIIWHFFDARTYKAGAVDQTYLVNLLEKLL